MKTILTIGLLFLLLHAASGQTITVWRASLGHSERVQMTAPTFPTGGAAWVQTQNADVKSSGSFLSDNLARLYWEQKVVVVAQSGKWVRVHLVPESLGWTWKSNQWQRLGSTHSITGWLHFSQLTTNELKTVPHEKLSYPEVLRSHRPGMNDRPTIH